MSVPREMFLVFERSDSPTLGLFVGAFTTRKAADRTKDAREKAGRPPMIVVRYHTSTKTMQEVDQERNRHGAR